jgi:hypothetical protein
MPMFLDIFAALLAWGAAVAWVLTGRGKLPPDLDHLQTGVQTNPARNLRAAYRARADRPAHDSPHIPNSPAGFLRVMQRQSVAGP